MAGGESVGLSIGLVGGAAAYHGKAFAALLSDYNRTRYEGLGWWAPERRVAGASVTVVWDADIEAARRLAWAAKIPRVAEEPEELLGTVDGVILVDDGSMRHQRHAGIFFHAGLPVFIDKPLAPSFSEARAIAAQASECGAPLMSCSALRFAAELATVRERLADVGEIVSVEGRCRGQMFYYGIHLLEALMAALPGDLELVGHGRRNEIQWAEFEHQRGYPVRLEVSEEWAYLLELTFRGSRGHLTVPFTDAEGFYGNLMEQVVRFVRRREADPLLARTLRQIELLEPTREDELSA